MEARKTPRRDRASLSVQAATLQKRENFEIAAGVRGAPRRGTVSIGQVRVGTVGQ